MSKRRRTRSSSIDRRWVIGGGIVLLLMTAALIVGNLSRVPPSAASAEVAAPTSALNECGDSSCGRADAPVTIEVYADFQCPYCKQADAILQQVMPPYITAGKARLVYENLPVIGPESQPAAEAVLCAADQNKFWTYANYLFARQGNENSGVFSNNNLKAFAMGLGLDAGQFNTCLDSGQHAATVQQQAAEARQRGVTGTPTFFIGGQRYEGVLSADQLTSLIEARQ